MRASIVGLKKSFLSSKLIFAIGIFAAAGLFFYLFSGICFPFIVGFVLAYLCEPMTEALSCYLNRTLVSLLLALCSLLLFVIIGYKIVPYVKEYLELFVRHAPAYYERFINLLNVCYEFIDPVQHGTAITDFQHELQQYFDQKIYIVASLIRKIALNSDSIASFFSFFVIMPISFFYFLKDWDLFVGSVLRCVPHRQKSAVIATFALVRKTFSDFFHGQFYVVTILSVYYGAFLFLTGITNWMCLGIVSGLFSFIPFIGAVFSLVIVLFINAPILSLTKVYIIIGVYLFGQLIEGYILSPKFIGKRTGLHPLWILFSFFAGIQLWGVWGVLIAIPLAAVIRNLIRFFMKKFRSTQTYKQ